MVFNVPRNPTNRNAWSAISFVSASHNQSTYDGTKVLVQSEIIGTIPMFSGVLRGKDPAFARFNLGHQSGTIALTLLRELPTSRQEYLWMETASASRSTIVQNTLGIMMVRFRTQWPNGVGETPSISCPQSPWLSLVGYLDCATENSPEAHLQTPEKLVIGVDVGGTKVAAGLVDGNGLIRCQTRIPMHAHGNAQEGFRAVTEAIDALLNSHDKDSVAGIGVCSPGPLDPISGVVINPPNVPCWRDFPLAQEVERKYAIPVRLDNDANAAALAEAEWGVGKGFDSVFYVTLGTGIGTGLVLNRKIFHGRTGFAGEGGHMSIDYHGPRCKCGKPGCIEIFASGPAIARRTQEKLIGKPSRDSLLRNLSAGNIESITSELVGKAYAQGDQLSAEVLGETVDLLALWLSSIVDLLDHDVTILGGGVSSLLSPFLDKLRERIAGFCINPRAHEIPLIQARYKADAGIAGGAALCLDLLSF